MKPVSKFAKRPALVCILTCILIFFVNPKLAIADSETVQISPQIVPNSGQPGMPVLVVVHGLGHFFHWALEPQYVTITLTPTSGGAGVAATATGMRWVAPDGKGGWVSPGPSPPAPARPCCMGITFVIPLSLEVSTPTIYNITISGTAYPDFGSVWSDGHASPDTFSTSNAEPIAVNPSPVATTIGGSTSFLYTGASPVQTGVGPSTIVPTRAAVLRGRVLDTTQSPLSGVTITVLNHPEFGSTQSQADGYFNMVVNGGGPLTLTYSMTGLLSAHRQLQVPWLDFALAPDVTLIPPDSNVTSIDLSSLVPIQVARGSVVTDGDGVRQATVYFPEGTTASKVTNGVETALPNPFHVRATECTVGADGLSAMPALLPPTSAYTYDVELSIDEALGTGASSVVFSQPVQLYLENFLNFPVGIDVPLGSYDKVGGAWVPYSNGRVIKILSETGGAADLDIDGSGVPAGSSELAELGITDAERQQLLVNYTVGQTLWRMPIQHFSLWDSNWGDVPPSDAYAPGGSGGGGSGGGGPIPGPRPPDPKPDCPNNQDGPIIECESQVLGERIPVAGTLFSLNYRSDRVAGRKAAYTLPIVLSGPTLPASLKRIDLEIDIAGTVYTNSFPPATNQSTTFTWDGKNAFNQTVQGAQLATVKIGYVYDGVYGKISKFGYNGNGIPITGNRTRREITLWQITTIPMGGFLFPNFGLGGWSLNVHHVYDVNDKVLYLGDGSRRSVSPSQVGINTVAGTRPNISSPGFAGDGGPANMALLNNPVDVAVGPDGSLYISDDLNARIRQVGPDGIINTVAGNGTCGYSGDGGPAIAASICHPHNVSIGPDGSVYIADTNNSRIRRVGPDGMITTVAGGGTGTGGLSGDGGPATSAVIEASGVAVAADGTLFIAEDGFYGCFIRRVSTDGIIDTVAGNGSFGCADIGDNGPALGAGLDMTGCDSSGSCIAVGTDGSLYITEKNYDKVRRINPSGIITTVAGAGAPGFSGDGGPALAAMFSSPVGVRVAGDGRLYIVDQGNGRIRRVGLDGIINTVAGIGPAISDSPGDGGPATAAGLSLVSGLALGWDGGFYVVETGGEVVRKIISAVPGFQLVNILVASDDGHEIYEFTGSGLHLRTIDALTNSTRYTFSYDTSGHLSTVTDQDGNITAIQHDISGNPQSIVAPFGQTTALSVDSNGYLASSSYPATSTFQMQYTPDGLLNQFTDPNNNISTPINYDPLGLLKLDTDAAGGSTQLTRTVGDQTYTVSATTAVGRTTKFTINSLGTGDQQNVTTWPDSTQATILSKTDGSSSITYADGTVVNITQGPDPRFFMQAPITNMLTIATGTVTWGASNKRSASSTTLTDRTTINGQVFTRSFDIPSRTFTMTSAQVPPRQTTSVLDTEGRLVQLQASGLAAISLSYWPNGKLQSVSAQGSATDPTRTFCFDYDSNGYLHAITDPIKRVLTVTPDPIKRTVQIAFPDGRTIGYSFDSNGNLTFLSPPGQPTHAFSATPVNLPLQYTPPLAPSTGNLFTTYGFNPDQQLASVTHPDGNTISSVYDHGTGKLSTVTLTSRGLSPYNYSYDPITGYLASISTPEGDMLTYGYNGALLSSVTWSGTVTGSVSRSRNNDLRTSSLSVNGSSPITYFYDPDGVLTKAGSFTLTPYVDKNGRLHTSAIGDEHESYDYNVFGEVSNFTAIDSINGTLLTESYPNRDQLGRIKQKIETIIDPTTKTTTTATSNYDYDPEDRLFQIHQNGILKATYYYDSNGNRKSDNTGAMVASYDNQDRLTTYGSTTYSYTPNGDLFTRADSAGTTTYNYDELGNLISVTQPSGTLIEYVIDGANRRVGKKIGGVLQQGFLYSDRFKPIAELDGTNTVVSLFVYATHANVPDYMLKSGNTYRIITDHLGSPRLVVDVGSGMVEQRIDYDEFGRVTSDTNPGFQPFGFAGGLYDQDTKLVHFGARDYDPETGRWVAKDPVLFNGGDANLYSYVRGDPINYLDSSGLCPTKTPNKRPFKECRDKFLDDYFWSHKYADIFSAQSGLGINGLDVFAEFWGAPALKLGAAGGAWGFTQILSYGRIFGDDIAVNNLIFSTPFWAKVAGKVVGPWAKAIGEVGLAATIPSATTEDLLAEYECEPVGPYVPTPNDAPTGLEVKGYIQ